MGHSSPRERIEFIWLTDATRPAVFWLLALVLPALLARPVRLAKVRFLRFLFGSRCNVANNTRRTLARFALVPAVVQLFWLWFLADRVPPSCSASPHPRTLEHVLQARSARPAWHIEVAVLVCCLTIATCWPWCHLAHITRWMPALLTVIQTFVVVHGSRWEIWATLAAGPASPRTAA